MSKKDKKIEIQVKDAKVIVNKAIIEGFELVVGKKVIGQIVEIDGKKRVKRKRDGKLMHSNKEGVSHVNTKRKIRRQRNSRFES